MTLPAPVLQECGFSLRDASFGVWVSAAMICAVGGSDDGKRAGAAPAAPAAFAVGGFTAVAVAATAAPVKNLRRSTFGPEFLRTIIRLPGSQTDSAQTLDCFLGLRKCYQIFSAAR